jgi:hypothetical protein
MQYAISTYLVFRGATFIILHGIQGPFSDVTLCKGHYDTSLAAKNLPSTQ